jgi:hypothetical protein
MDSTRKPSHLISEEGNRVTIHDLELFVGHIDGFDDEDSDIKDLDSEKIEEIIAQTNRHISAGANPKLVLLHQDENGNSPTESIGDIVNIHSKPIKINCSEGESYEGAGIVGDVEMSKSDFQKYLASNRYPRRSAEIWEDGHLSEVALLGRETPARPLRDTKFTRKGPKKVFHRPATFDMVSPGGSNTYIPSGSDEKEAIDMPDTILEGEEQILMRKLRADNAALNDELDKLKAQLAELEPDDEKEEYDEDEEGLEKMIDACAGNCGDDKEKDEYDEEEEEDLKKVFSRLRKTNYGGKVIAKFAKLKKERNKYKRRAIALSNSVKKQRFNRILDQLATKGYRVRQHRQTMLEELMSCKDPVSKVKFWESTMKKIPFGKKLNTKNTRQSTKVNFSQNQKKIASEAAVARIAKEKLEASSFQKVFQQELRKL